MVTIMHMSTLAFVAVSHLLAQTAPVAQPGAPAEPPATTPATTPPAAAPTTAPPAAAPVAPAECIPACRSGYVCHQGQCISACNPPCAAGEVCTGAGVCERTAAAPVAAAPVAAAPTVPAPAEPVPVAPPAPALEPEKARVPRGANLHVNALGLLQFGLIPRLELGGSTTFLLGAHFFNTGALSYVVIPGGEEELNFSVGGNLGVRTYFHAKGGQRGGYFGAFLEYASIATTDDSDDRAKYERGLLIPAVDAGYRWVWGKFLLDLGGVAGAAFVVSAKDTPIGPDGCAYSDSCLEESDTTAFGMGMLDVGFFF
jgi:hypothetical protein